MKIFLTLALFIIWTTGFAQPVKYTVANAHSHNDYEQSQPFEAAYRAGFGSIEADIFLSDFNRLLVAHTTEQLKERRVTLDSLYLKPLSDSIRKNGGSVYADPSKTLQLMIDIKTESVSTLNALVETIAKYPALIIAPSLRIVISGNRPDPETYSNYPPHILFDGVISANYSPKALERIAMMSGSFREFSKWDGNGELSQEDSIALSKVVTGAHGLNKPVRLWAAPDNENAWKVLMRLGVDFINTDKIDELKMFLN